MVSGAPKMTPKGRPATGAIFGVCVARGGPEAPRPGAPFERLNGSPRSDKLDDSYTLLPPSAPEQGCPKRPLNRSLFWRSGFPLAPRGCPKTTILRYPFGVMKKIIFGPPFGTPGCPEECPKTPDMPKTQAKRHAAFFGELLGVIFDAAWDPVPLRWAGQPALCQPALRGWPWMPKCTRILVRSQRIRNQSIE